MIGVSKVGGMHGARPPLRCSQGPEKMSAAGKGPPLPSTLKRPRISSTEGSSISAGHIAVPLNDVTKGTRCKASAGRLPNRLSMHVGCQVGKDPGSASGAGLSGGRGGLHFGPI